MWSFDDLPDVTDSVTISRGHAYARSGRVTAMSTGDGSLYADVQGSVTYRVRLGEATWECDCPVGVTGAFCKHCVAVAIAACQNVATDDDTPSATEAADPDGAWLGTLQPAELRDLLHRARRTVAGMDEFLTRERIAATNDLAALKAQVEEALRPRRRFYDYRDANDYADAAEPTIGLLHDHAETPSVELLKIVERAIELTVRTILRSDDSSGHQGDQVERLLDLHAEVATALAGDLDAKGRRRLATWLHTFRFSGTQDFFDPDVDAYADVLTSDGVTHYRALVERSAATGADTYAVEHARGRLAILERDPEVIAAHFGGDMSSQYLAERAVAALDEAGLHRHAVQYAERGLDLPRTHRTRTLVDRLVRDAVDRGDLDRALTLRRTDFRQDPHSTTLGLYRDAATASGVWADEQGDAERHLARHRPHEWIGVLLGEGRDEEAWEFAVAHPTDASVGQHWERLCARRARNPETAADTLPVYRELVEQALVTTGRGSYATASNLLLRMREAAGKCGRGDEFRDFMAATTEKNRRRPTCLDMFRRNGLLDRDGAVVV